MTTIAHAVSASYITYLAIVGVNQELNLPLLFASILPAILLDADHLYYALKHPQKFHSWQKNGQLHYARSILHEITGLTLVFTITIILAFVIDTKLVQAILLSYTIHVAQDMIMGISKPLNGINNTEIQLFTFSFNQKVIVDLLTCITFGGLWILLLINLPG